MMSLALLFVAGVLGGALNSVAGGGSFVVFPLLLLAVGIPPVAANATTAVGLWPAGVASIVAYRRELPRTRSLAWLGGVSALGGGAGALLLVRTSDATFARLVPWLLLCASAVFTFGPTVTRLRPRARLPFAGGVLLQLAIATYGGYFGGGMGILMLAVYTLLGMTDIHAMNALKVVQGVLINGVAVALFLVAGKVDLSVAAPIGLGGITGGFVGAALARRLAATRVRGFVLVVAWSMTAYFFTR